jgi:hypothetical protein
LGQLEGAEERQAETAVFAAAGAEGEREIIAKTGRREDETFAGAEVAVGFAAVVIYVNPELEKLRQLVAGARARLAELEVSFTKEKSRVDAMQAILFRRLHEHYQKCDRLRLIVDYRKRYLEALRRCGKLRKTRTDSFSARAGRVWTSARKWNSRSCGGCTKRCNWKSSRSWNH